MTFNESVEYLSSLHTFGWRLDLSRMEALCERLGHPERAFRSVHVAGTNGKGSTTAMVAGILAAAGYRTGAYFSPYVFNVRERVMLAEPRQRPQMIPEGDFARLMSELRPHVEDVATDEDLGQPTEFETKTMLAFLFFRERAVDMAVLETGLGGRLDATNVVRPEAAVITNVGLDHTERLGDTIEQIAGEKAGIVKPGAAVVTGATEPALSVVRKAWASRGASEWAVTVPPAQPGDPWSGFIEANRTTETVSLTAQPTSPAAYQRANAALAELTARILQERGIAIPEDAIREGVACASLPGRFQIIRENPTVILDGAHNTEGAHELATSLRARYPGRPITLIIGMMGRHSVEGVVSELAPLAKRIIATQPSDERHLPARKVVERAATHGLEAPVITPPMEALRTALDEASPETVVVVTGSFYTVGEVDVDAVGSWASP